MKINGNEPLCVAAVQKLYASLALFLGMVGLFRFKFSRTVWCEAVNYPGKISAPIKI